MVEEGSQKKHCIHEYSPTTEPLCFVSSGSLDRVGSVEATTLLYGVLLRRYG